MTNLLTQCIWVEAIVGLTCGIIGYNICAIAHRRKRDAQGRFTK